jgi:excinuclease UvrABC nuclease subunit
LGKPAKKKKAEPIDFREQTGIYVLYDNFKVLYVGQAGYGNAKLFNRLKAHFTDSLADRWNRFSWFGLRWVKADGDLSGETKAKHPPIGDVLNHMEAILIASTEPALNRQGGRWGKAVQYLQDEDTELEPRTEEMIRQLYERMEEQKEAEEKAKKKAKKKKP